MHQVIILWAHPRSISTAIERIMRERADFDRLCRQAPQLRSYLDHHLPYYEKLQRYSVTCKPHG